MSELIEPTQQAEDAFVQFWGHVGPWIASGEADPEDVAHEAYHAGWEAARGQTDVPLEQTMTPTPTSHYQVTCPECAARKPGSPVEHLADTPWSGYVWGECGHPMAGSEWRAGYRNCEHCLPDELEKDDP